MLTHVVKLAQTRCHACMPMFSLYSVHTMTLPHRFHVPFWEKNLSNVPTSSLPPLQQATDDSRKQTTVYAADAKIGILPKIESADSVGHLSDILDAADGAMVARGDLGAELPVQEVSKICLQLACVERSSLDDHQNKLLLTTSRLRNTRSCD